MTHLLMVAQTVVKGVFVMLDPANVGVLTYVQFRDAVQDVIPSSQTASQNTGSVVATNSWTRDAPARHASRKVTSMGSLFTRPIH